MLKQFSDDASKSAGMGGREFYPEDTGLRFLCNASKYTTHHHIPE
jgi:hypothetical protein